jgi:hypothetical protein
MVRVPDEPTENEPELTPSRAGAPGRGVLPLFLLAAVTVLALGVAGFEYKRADDADHRIGTLEARVAALDDAGADRAAVADVAGQFGVALLSYDYQDLNTARERVLALATTRFGGQYTDAFVNGLDDAITQFQAVADATLLDVYVADIEGDSAKAVVVLDAEVRSTEGTRRTVSSYIDLRLVREGGSWKVDVATSLAALEQDTTPTPGLDTSTSTTTSTTVGP